jgi:hypothetical protein
MLPCLSAFHSLDYVQVQLYLRTENLLDFCGRYLNNRRGGAYHSLI